MEVANYSIILHDHACLFFGTACFSNFLLKIALSLDKEFTMTENYHLGLLYLVHLLVSSDGHVDETELAALQQIKTRENISDNIFKQFEQDVLTKTERQIYEEGIQYLNKCNNDEKMKAFVILYKMSEVDGRVHVKEVRLLLYSIKVAGIEFDDVVEQAAKMTSYY